jgi:hypothetical protein
MDKSDERSFSLKKFDYINLVSSRKNVGTLSWEGGGGGGSEVILFWRLNFILV